MHNQPVTYPGLVYRPALLPLLPPAQTNLVTAGPEDKLSDAEAKMKGIEGVPVVDADGKASWLVACGATCGCRQLM